MRTRSFLLSLLLLAVLAGCGNDDDKVFERRDRKAQVEVAIDVTTQFSQNGRLKAILKSPRMLRHVGDSTVIEFPTMLHVDFYDSLGKVESYLDARYARYAEHRNLVLLRDSVRVINVRGDTLRTQELWWDQNARVFYTDSVVRIVQPDKRIRGGRGLEAAQDMSWYVIKFPTGIMDVKDEQFAAPPPADTSAPASPAPAGTPPPVAPIKPL
ncbi:LPS export ABC transporter periplasmic protein LptC [Flaviaesturariibacter amylovorans]|uniref:LPS export ABC transporter periplasmic protein LptC n=1 Tax=Flaviaesturariibacter amylovorans TaxID=1084520 RepID=A0ABP8HJM9_9BACT